MPYLATRFSQWHTTIMAFVVLWFAIGTAWAQTVPPLTFIGETRLETGFIFEETVVGGLSGLAYIPLLGHYIALSDDHAPGSDERMYELSIDLSDGALNDGDVVLTKVTRLLDREGVPFVDQTVDPEAIRFDPTSLTLYWSSEGNANNLVAPSIREMTFSGRFVREFIPPMPFLPTADGTSGIRHNLAFESLALSWDGSHLWTATENALHQDGPSATIDDPSPIRIVEFDIATGMAGHQFVYITEPIPPPLIPDARNTNGLVAMLAVSETQLIMVERALALPSFVIKLYLADITNATDVSTLDRIEDQEVQPAEKRLLFDLTTLGIRLDNIEGITFGPDLPSGERSLVLVSDNNFNTLQFTQFLAFRVDGEF